MQCLAKWSQSRQPWAMVSLSALGLLLAALYFQHALGHAPCVKCIYQRTAVIGIFIGALIPLLYPHIVLRALGMIVWGSSAIWGLSVAREHLEVIFPQGFFVPPCPFAPEFPSFMPLDKWLPTIFDAPGSCNDNTWQFLSMGMPEWLQIIFILYILGWLIALAAFLWSINLSLRAAK